MVHWLHNNIVSMLILWFWSLHCDYVRKFLALERKKKQVFRAVLINGSGKKKKRYTSKHRPCADQRHLNPGTRGNENMEAGCEAPSCCCSHRTLPSAALPLLAGGPEFSLTSAAISGFLLRFHWGRKDYYYCYFFTSEKSFLFPKAKNSSNEIPPFFSFFCSFTS